MTRIAYGDEVAFANVCRSSHRWISLQQGTAEQDIHDLDMHLGKLYEDIDAKVQSSCMVLKLAKRTRLLETIASHTSALIALARVLREDGKKNFLLRLNIISIFYIFSFFQNFHKILFEQQVGKTTLYILDMETQPRNDQLEISKYGEIDGVLVQSKKTSLLKGLASRGRSAPFHILENDRERLLYVSVYLLLNIAEDEDIEKKMRKYNLVQCLCRILLRDNISLRFITVTFLMRFSIFKENVRVMKENGIVSKLYSLMKFENALLNRGVLKLLWNLSFDTDIRINMLIYRSDEMEMFFRCALKVHQPLLFKLIRNLSEVESIQLQLVGILPSFVTLLPDCEPCIQVEVMGVLCNMVSNDLNVYLVDDDFLLYLSNYFVMSKAEDDIILEMIMFVGGCCTHETASAIAGTGIVSKICTIFLDKKKDKDMKLQCMHTFKQFLLFEPTRVQLLGYSKKVIISILGLSMDTCKLIATHADELVDIISEDPNWFAKIRRWRFEMYNPDWIQDQEPSPAKEVDNSSMLVQRV